VSNIYINSSRVIQRIPSDLNNIECVFIYVGAACPFESKYYTETHKRFTFYLSTVDCSSAKLKPAVARLQHICRELSVSFAGLGLCITGFNVDRRALKLYYAYLEICRVAIRCADYLRQS
jgi:hypothetical protein